MGMIVNCSISTCSGSNQLCRERQVFYRQNPCSAGGSSTLPNDVVYQQAVLAILHVCLRRLAILYIELLSAMRMSETDPLLPNGSSAPEISGYGFSKTQIGPLYEVVDPDRNALDEDDEQSNTGYNGFSPLRTLTVLFAVVVGCAIFITLLFPGAFNAPALKPVDDTMTVKARVHKILSENPLIGLYCFLSTIIHQVSKYNVRRAQ